MLTAVRSRCYVDSMLTVFIIHIGAQIVRLGTEFREASAGHP